MLHSNLRVDQKGKKLIRNAPFLRFFPPCDLWYFAVSVRIIESLGWKRPLRSSPTVNPSPPCLLNHVLKCQIYTVFEHLQGWWLHHFPGQPIPMLHNSFSKEIFLVSNLNLPWHNLRSLTVVLSLVTLEKRLTPTSLHPPVRQL